MLGKKRLIIKNMKKFFEAIQKQSRDNARTPMQWDNKKNAGFSKVKPWIKVNDNYKENQC